MKTLIVLALLVLSSGCGKAIDPTFKPYLDRFQAIVNAQYPFIHTNNIVIQFGTVMPSATGLDVAGECFMNTGVILISQSFWSTATDESKELIIFHELGHCVLYRGHNNKVDAFNVPTSIMTPNQSEALRKAYAANKAAYIQELFLGH